MIADRVYTPEDVVRVPSSQGLVTFEFQGSSFTTRPERMAYVYRLRGHEEEWRSTRESQVRYSDLPVGTYTFEVKAVDRDLNYSTEPAAVEVEVYLQSFSSPVRLADLQLGDVFASFHGTYAQHPVGSVQVVNDDPEPTEVTLRFSLPELMRRPLEQTLTLASQSSQMVELLPRLDADILQVRDTRTLQAEVELEFERDGQLLSIKRRPEITV